MPSRHEDQDMDGDASGDWPPDRDGYLQANRSSALYESSKARGESTTAHEPRQAEHLCRGWRQAAGVTGSRLCAPNRSPSDRRRLPGPFETSTRCDASWRTRHATAMKRPWDQGRRDTQPHASGISQPEANG